MAACQSLLKLCNEYTGIYYTSLFTFVYIWNLSATSLKVSTVCEILLITMLQYIIS